jgi:hypothetical protein
MTRKFFVAALALLALTSFNALRVNAQQSACPLEAFGSRPALPVNKSLQSQIEVTHFTTNDPNAFMSEKAGIARSASYLSVSTNQFVAKLDSLERDGLASIRKQQSAVAFLGEMAELNLERNSVNNRAGMVNASLSSANLNDIAGLDRKTEISIFKGNASDGDFYRVSLLSWFVDVTARGGQKVVDYDAIVLLKPGQTAIFKLRGDSELKRNGAARSYIAVTMKSVNDVGLASHGRNRNAVAKR